MSTPLNDQFDGTWRFVNEKEEEGWNYLHFSRGNRIVQFFNIKGGDYQNGQMLVSDAGDSKIQFYPEDGSEGWTRGYRFDDGNLVIVEGDDEYPCEPVTEKPDWLAKGIVDSDEYFNQNESNWGTKK